VLERGAIEGTVFHSGAIAALAPEGLRAQVRPRLLALARKELIRPDRAEFTGEDAFRFRHMLIRDAAYQALPKEQRADLHERFADWLTRVAGDRMGVHEEILGYHLDQAYRYRSELGRIDETTRDLGRRAGRALRASAERALARGDHHTMARLLERAIALLDGYEHAAAQVELGEGLALNDVELPAMVVLRAFLATDAATEWPALGIRARVFLSFTESSTDPTLSQVRMEQHLGSLLAEAEALGDDQAIVACLLGVGQVASWLGETRRQREISERLLARLDDVGIGYRGWVAAGFRTEAYWGATPVDEAFAEVETARRIVGDNVVHGLVCDAIVIGLLVMADRQADATLALERYRRSVAEFPDGIPLSMAQILAEALWRLGRPTEAIDELRLDNERRTARGETGINSTTTGRLAHYLAESGEIEAATATLDDARAMSAADDIATLMEIAWTTAILARMRGDLDAAIGAIDEAIDILRPTDALNHLAEILELRGHILASAGERAQAAATLDEAMTLFERKGNVLGARLLREWRAAH
jgi:tetratricopeptide (TPR) repeat protein